MGIAEHKPYFDPTPYVREGIDAHDVLALKEAFDALDESRTGHVEISKLRKNGFDEQLFSQIENDRRASQITKERVDPFSVLDEKDSTSKKINEYNDPGNPFGNFYENNFF